MVFFGLNFSGKKKKIQMKMNNISHVWQSLEGFRENFISKKATLKRKTHTSWSWFCSYPFTTVMLKCVFTTLTVR